jgi:hypothetical protein
MPRRWKSRKANLSDDEWQAYEREKIAEQDFRGGLSLAEKLGRERGEKRGLAKGRKEGEKRGLAKGLAKGREGRRSTRAGAGDLDGAESARPHGEQAAASEDPRHHRRQAAVHLARPSQHHRVRRRPAHPLTRPKTIHDRTDSW